jgi:hypothetical protein
LDAAAAGPVPRVGGDPSAPVLSESRGDARQRHTRDESMYALIVPLQSPFTPYSAAKHETSTIRIPLPLAVGNASACAHYSTDERPFLFACLWTSGSELSST